MKGKTPLFQAFNIEQQIEKIRSARVDLPSGGYIIIQEAEGLCAIDVNTGKFTGKKSQEETVTATNVEAAKEVGAPAAAPQHRRHHRDRLHRYAARAQSPEGDGGAGQLHA